MVEEVVVIESLSPKMIEAGEELVRLLDQIHFDVRAALWLYVSEVGTWRLIIASPDVKRGGPRKTYKKVQSVLSKMQDRPRVGLENISVVDSHDPLVSLLRTALKTGPHISGIRFSRNTINGHFIEDAYIYRLA